MHLGPPSLERGDGGGNGRDGVGCGGRRLPGVCGGMGMEPKCAALLPVREGERWGWEGWGDGLVQSCSGRVS